MKETYPDFEIHDNRKTDKDILTKPVEDIKEPIKIQVVEAVYGEPTPRFNQILVANDEKQTTWQGSTIIIPDSASKEPNRGLVISIGDFYIVNGVSRPISEIVNVGDIVTYNQYTDERVTIGDKSFKVITVFDIQLVQKKYGTSSDQIAKLASEISSGK